MDEYVERTEELVFSMAIESCTRRLTEGDSDDEA